jgi:hypothetical protein
MRLVRRSHPDPFERSIAARAVRMGLVMRRVAEGGAGATRVDFWAARGDGSEQMLVDTGMREPRHSEV